jgi:hypothetical protein
LSRFVVLVLIALVSQVPATAAPRKITVADDIALRNFNESALEATVGEATIPSPDGARVAFVVTFGDLVGDAVVSEIYVAQTGAKPQKLAVFRQTKADPAEENPVLSMRWDISGEALLLIAPDASGVRQAMRVDAQSGRVEQLTHHVRDVIGFDLTSDGGTLVFVGKAAPLEAPSGAVLISDQYFLDLIAPNSPQIDAGDFRLNEVYVQRVGAVKRLNLEGFKPLGMTRPVLSPSGDGFVLAMVRPITAADQTAYKTPQGSVIVIDYVLVDSVSGATRPIGAAPASYPRGRYATWDPSGSSVALTNVYAPRTSKSASDTVTKVVHLKDGSTDLLAEGGLRFRCAVNCRSAQLLEGLFAPKQVGVIEPSEGAWRFRVQDPSSSPAPRFRVAQDYRTLPKLMASIGGRDHLVLDPNPDLRQESLAKVEEVSWTGPDGKIWKAGLFYPRGYRRGRVYPLVVQTHGWDNRVFTMSGLSSAGYAAQALASDGVFVLQLPDRPATESTPDEGAGAMALYESAIDMLVARSLVDQSRIGIMGWSRTGLHVRYALVHSRHKFAAAMVVDGMDGGYFQYILDGTHWLYETMNGGVPRRTNLPTWLEKAPPFGAEKVTAPVLQFGFGPYALAYNWESHTMLRKFGKLVETHWLPLASHAPLKPSDRQKVQKTAVDWWRFWLKLAVPPASENVERWKLLIKVHCSTAERIGEICDNR